MVVLLTLIQLIGTGVDLRSVLMSYIVESCGILHHLPILTILLIEPTTYSTII